MLPPTLEADTYQALAIIPGIEVDSHVTAIDGQPGVAFVLPPTPQSEQLEIILDASDYRFLGKGSWDNSTSFHEADVVRMVIVGAHPPATAPPPAARRERQRWSIDVAIAATVVHRCPGTGGWAGAGGARGAGWLLGLRRGCRPAWAERHPVGEGLYGQGRAGGVAGDCILSVNRAWPERAGEPTGTRRY